MELSKRAVELLKVYDQGALTELFVGGYIDNKGLTQKALDWLSACDGGGTLDFDECARQLKAVWPKGSGPYGPWSGAQVLVRKRLMQWARKYEITNQYTVGGIVDAAKRYLANPEFAMDKRYMSTLENFIFKDRLGAAGTVDEASKLLTFLEDKDAGTRYGEADASELR